MRHTVSILLILAFGAVAMAMPKGMPKLSRDLVRLIETAKPGQTAEVIVQFEEGPGQAELRKVEALGGKQVRVFTSIRAGIYSIPLANLNKLATDASVVRIAPNRHLSAQKPSAARGVLTEGDPE